MSARSAALYSSCSVSRRRGEERDRTKGSIVASTAGSKEPGTAMVCSRHEPRQAARIFALASIGGADIRIAATESSSSHRGVGVTDQFEIVFDTLASTRKAQNLRRNPRIALVIGGWTPGDERIRNTRVRQTNPPAANCRELRKLITRHTRIAASAQTGRGSRTFASSPVGFDTVTTIRIQLRSLNLQATT